MDKGFIDSAKNMASAILQKSKVMSYEAISAMAGNPGAAR